MEVAMRWGRLAFAILGSAMIVLISGGVATAAWRTASATAYDPLRICTDGMRVLLGDFPYDPAFGETPPPADPNASLSPQVTQPPWDPPQDPNDPNAPPPPAPAGTVLFGGRSLHLAYDFYDPPDVDGDPNDTRVWTHTGRFELIFSKPATPGAMNLGFDVEPDSFDDTVGILDVANCKLDRSLDIRPFSSSNPITPSSRLPVPVLVKGSSFLNAGAIVGSSVRFGPAGAKQLASVTFDVDKDGDLDRLMLFRPRDTGIACGDTVTDIRLTSAGHYYDLFDSIKTVNC
jgi:hypothetical protein